jgi:hypothetical protein
VAFTAKMCHWMARTQKRTNTRLEDGLWNTAIHKNTEEEVKIPIPFAQTLPCTFQHIAHHDHARSSMKNSEQVLWCQCARYAFSEFKRCSSTIHQVKKHKQHEILVSIATHSLILHIVLDSLHVEQKVRRKSDASCTAEPSVSRTFLPADRRAKSLNKSTRYMCAKCCIPDV